MIAFEGLNGSGKTTQLHILADQIAQSGKLVQRCVDPGSTRLGDAIRSIVKNKDFAIANDTIAAMLFSAARAQMVEEVIRPAIAAGKIVLTDRYNLSMLAYQMAVRCVSNNQDIDRTMMSVACIDSMHEFIEYDVKPFYVFIDVPPRLAYQRAIAATDTPDRYEARGEAFFHELRDCYMRVITLRSLQQHVVDGSGSPEEVNHRIRGLLSDAGIDLGP